MKRMSLASVNLSTVSTVTKVSSDVGDMTVDDTPDRKYSVDRSDDSLPDLTYQSHMTNDVTVIADTPPMLNLSHCNSDMSSDVITLSDKSSDYVTVQPYQNITDTHVKESCDSNDNKLTAFSPGGTGFVCSTGLVTATTTLTNIMTEIKSCSKTDTSILSKTMSVKMHGTKRKSVFADGSTRIDSFLSVDDILSCTPLFLRQPLMKRRRHAPFVSTAMPKSNVKGQWL